MAVPVHCDDEPIVLADAAALLRGTGDGVTEYLQAAVRDADSVLDGAKKILDFGRPVALSLIALFPFVPDEDGARELLRRLPSELLSGSYPVAGHATADFTPEEPKAPTEQLKAAGLTWHCAPR